MTIDRQKYIVFKREEFKERMSLKLEEPLSFELHDAVVIRKKDPFAASALHAYASSILTTIELLKITGVNGALADRLLELADYFAGEADDAIFGSDRKIPD